MIRRVFAYVLALFLSVTSISFALARGTNPDLGTQIVICSGVGMTTITVGADGQPVETTHLCPDGASIFAADFALPGLEVPAPVLIALRVAYVAVAQIGRQALAPSARDPPAQV